MCRVRTTAPGTAADHALCAAGAGFTAIRSDRWANKSAATAATSAEDTRPPEQTSPPVPHAKGIELATLAAAGRLRRRASGKMS
jgi:hypothetical protein